MAVKLPGLGWKPSVSMRARVELIKRTMSGGFWDDAQRRGSRAFSDSVAPRRVRAAGGRHAQRHTETGPAGLRPVVRRLSPAARNERANLWSWPVQGYRGRQRRSD